MATTDQVLGRRRVLLGSFLVGWMAWYGFFIGQQTGLYGDMTWQVEMVTSGIGLIGWFIFAVSMIKIMNFRKRYKDDPEAMAALEDDLQKAQAAKASRYGFIALLATQVILVGVSERLGISGTAAAHLSIFVGVAAVLGSALILDLVE